MDKKNLKSVGRMRTQDISYLKQAPTGVPGDITRPDESNVEPIMLVGVGDPLVYPAALGVPLKLVTGGAQQFNGGEETKASFAGILVREAPGLSGGIASDSVLTPVAPNPLQPQGMLVRGYISVLCVAGTPARGGVVYVQITAHSGANPGDFRADGTDSGNAIALDLTQATWATDGLDANLNAEIRVQTVL